MQARNDVVVVAADLLGTARVEGAAATVGLAAKSVSLERLADELRASAPRLVLVDLDRGREGALDVLDELRKTGVLSARVVAYVSHVDERLASTARERGYETWARGRMWRSLEELLRA